VSHNVIWHRDGGGIAVSNSDCEKINGNLVIDNTQKGIEVRDSLESRVEQNTILSNHSAGIWVSGQRKGAQTYLSGNVLAANGSGLAGAIGESIYLEANDFTQQFPQFLSGDLTAQFRSVALDLRGTKPIVLLASDSVKNDPPKTTCSN
jgi:parallel beta-helix repeat protein